MEQETVIQEQKPRKKTFKDKINRFFNVIYIITTLVSFLYYAFYSYSTIKEYGFDNEMILKNVISYMLVVAVVAYALILIISAIISSSVKTAKGRINKASVYLGYFKKIIKLMNILVSVIILASAVAATKISDVHGFKQTMAYILSIIQLVFTVFKLMFKTASLTTKIGVNTTKKIIKKKVAKAKAEKQSKKIASQSEEDQDAI